MGASNANIEKQSSSLTELMKNASTISKRVEQMLKNISMYLNEKKHQMIAEDLNKLDFKDFTKKQIS